MGHPLRMYEASDYWFITARCFQARKLMTPHTSLVREVCGGVLARAADKHDVGLLAFAFMSNHLHLVVRARGPAVAAFIKYLLGNLSRKLAPLCTTRWFGRFWERRSSVAPILDAPALADRLRYVVAHGVKEGLVARAEEWEGLHCAAQLVDGRARSFKWFDWTKRWRSRNRGGFAEGALAGRYDDEWAQPVELRLEPLPQWAQEGADSRQRLARALLDEVEAEEETRRASAPVLGMAAVKRESAAPPRGRKRGQRPWCHSSTREGRRSYRRAYRAFVDAFQAAARTWLRGDVTAMFPAGCFKPHVHNHIQIV